MRKLNPLPCVSCGYDMRGVRMVRGEWPLVRCPECGHACDCRTLREHRLPNAFVVWLWALGPAVPLLLMAILAPQWLETVEFLFAPGMLGMLMLVALPVGHAMAIEASAGMIRNPSSVSMAAIARVMVTIALDLGALFAAANAVMGSRVVLE